MMSRDRFRIEFARGIRLVLQKHEREMTARLASEEVSRQAGTFPDSDYLRTNAEKAGAALQEANGNLDAAIEAFGEHVFAAIDLSQEP